MGYSSVFDKKIKGLDSNDNAIDADRLLDVIVGRLRVVMINLNEREDPFLIFESLNARGEPLKQADLVRNYVLMRFKHSSAPDGGEQERVHREKWMPMESLLGDQLEEFLRHCVMTDGENVRKGHTYAAMKRHFGAEKSETDVERRMEQLHNDAKIYKKIVSPNGSAGDQEISDGLSAIASLDATISYPFLLRAFRAFDQKKLTKPDLLKCLRLIESFLVRRAVCELHRQGLNKLFVQWCKGYQTQDTVAWLSKEMQSGETASRRFPNDEEFSEAIRSKPLYEKKLVPRHMLVQIEKSYGHRESPDINLATLEHVLPQKLSLAWKQSLGSGASAIHASLVDTLPNLTLSAYNSEMGNKSFDEKKAIFSLSNLEMNRWICAQPVWDAEAIRKRGNLLVVKALELWPSRL